MTYTLKTAGAVVIEDLTLTTCLGDTINIQPQMVSININEDMFAPCLTGSIQLEDGIGLLEKLPISCNEKLTILFYSYDYSPLNRECDFFHRTFDILKITNITSITDYTKSYVLHFASPELKMNETIKISKAYQSMSISQVVAAIMTGAYSSDTENPDGLNFPTSPLAEKRKYIRSPHLQPSEIETELMNLSPQNSVELFVEKTKYTEPWITIPYSRPFTAIRNLCARAIRLSGGRFGAANSGQVANFVFFENKRGFQFTSIETLLENKDEKNPLVVFKFGDAAQNSTDQRTVEHQTIDDIQFLTTFDVIDQIQNGTYASKLITYDMVTGEMRETDYDFAKQFDNTESTESFSGKKVWPSIFLDENNSSELTTKAFSKLMFLPQNPTLAIDNITSSTTQRLNNSQTLLGPEEFVARRLSQLGRLSNIRLAVKIAGNSRYKAGDLVELDLRQMPLNFQRGQKLTEEQVKYYSGNYLITSISHQIGRINYSQTIEMVKDSHKEKIGSIGAHNPSTPDIIGPKQ